MGNPLGKVYDRFIRLRGNPREIGLGFALGLFLGFSPTMGVQLASAVALASLFKWNKYAAAIGVWITNPLTAPFIYGFTYVVGARLTGVNNSYKLSMNFNWDALVDLIQNSPGIMVSLLVGGVVVGLPAAVLGYFAAYGAVDKYQRDLKEKLRQKKDRLKQKVRRKKRKQKAAAPGEKPDVRPLASDNTAPSEPVIGINPVDLLEQEDHERQQNGSLRD